MTKRKKIIISVICILLIFILVVLLLGANYLVSFAIGRTTGTTDVAPPSVVAEEDSRTISENWRNLIQQTQAWGETVHPETVTIKAADGLTLNGEYALYPEFSHLWVIAVHGYRGNHAHMYSFASFYGQHGYNVLLPDLRGCGASEGDYIGMGWPDRKDMLQWIGWIIKRDPEAQIVLHGISMGGATVIMVSGEDLPPQVKVIVEDCGYTSVWDIFKDEMDALFHLPAFPILNIASIISSFRAGYNFTEASSLEQVKKAKVPMLFIHGEKDNFVHTDMVYPLYEACPTEKQILVMEGAGHGSSFSMDPDLYFNTVFDFVEKYVKQ